MTIEEFNHRKLITKHNVNYKQECHDDVIDAIEAFPQQLKGYNIRKQEGTLKTLRAQDAMICRYLEDYIIPEEGSPIPSTPQATAAEEVLIDKIDKLEDVIEELIDEEEEIDETSNEEVLVDREEWICFVPHITQRKETQTITKKVPNPNKGRKYKIVDGQKQYL